jgi:CheY-like chemotaxis protein
MSVRHGRTGQETGWAINAPQRVLIVDDDPSTRYVYRQVLDPLGLTLDEAASGDEAIHALGEAAPDLVVLDMLLPGTPGTAVLSYIYREPHLTHTSVLIITAHHSWPDLQLRNRDRMLYKPVSPRSMRQAAQDVLHLPPQAR